MTQIIMIIIKMKKERKGRRKILIFVVVIHLCGSTASTKQALPNTYDEKYYR